DALPILTAPIRFCVHLALCWLVLMDTNTVRFRPSAFGSSSTAVRSMTPSSFIFWMRRQHGVTDRLTCSAISATGRVASFCSRLRIFRSVWSMAFSRAAAGQRSGIAVGGEAFQVDFGPAAGHDVGHNLACSAGLRPAIGAMAAVHVQVGVAGLAEDGRA